MVRVEHATGAKGCGSIRQHRSRSHESEPSQQVRIGLRADASVREVL
jgi:hypothetical protein